MTEIALISKSQIKIDAVREFFTSILKRGNPNIDDIKENKNLGLPPQPLNNGGAISCLKRLESIENYSDYDYIISIENYIGEKTQRDHCYCILQYENKRYYGISYGIECQKREILEKMLNQKRDKYFCEGVEKTYGEFLHDMFSYIEPNNWMKYQGQDRKKQIHDALSIIFAKIALDREIKLYKDFPTKGVIFQDLMPLLEKPQLYKALVSLMVGEININLKDSEKIDYIVGPELRGCIFGSLLASELNCGFIPIRKEGKLPGPKFQSKYKKEYGEDTLEMEFITQGKNVIIFDDLVATGGSLEACIKLCQYNGLNIMDCIILKDVPELREQYLKKMNEYNITPKVILQNI